MRPRLLDKLDRGLAHGLMLVVAPAGYGKTSLVVDWLAQRSALAAAWVSLDESDNDPDIFLSYLTTAVDRAFSPARPCANTQALLGGPQPPPADKIGTTLINDLAGLSQPLLLVLDDYHLITHPTIREVMAALVRHQPAPLKLMIISRNDPALQQLPRRRVQQLLLEIGAGDLRVDPAEARAILTQTSGAAVDETTAALLEEQMEGWVIGLQLAGLSLRDQEDPEAFVRAFQARQHRLVMDFLLDDVLAHQPRPILDFLLKTAVLEQLDDSLCATVVGERAGDETPLLANLAGSGLFLIALDEEGTRFRYHRLFRELLLRRLAQNWGQAEIAALHGRAGGWLAAHGDAEEALRHLLAAGDVAAAVALVEDRRHDLLNQGEMHRLTRRLGLLPEDVVARRPALLQLKAWTLRWQAKFQAIPALLQDAEALLEQEAAVAGAESVAPEILRAERDGIRAEMALFRSEFRACLTLAQSALDRLPSHYFYARGLAAFCRLVAQQNLGQTKAALRQLNAWLDDEQFRHYALRHALLVAAGAIYGSTGDLRRLEQTGRSLLKLGLDEEQPLSITWGSHFLGHVYYHWNRLDEAHAHWSAVLDWRYQANFRAYHEAMLGLALVCQTRNDEAQARQTLDTLTQDLLELKQVQFVPEVEALRARLALLGGDAAAAVYWVRTGDPPARMPLWFWETNELTRVKVLIARGTTATCREAADLLAACRRYAEGAHNNWLLIQVWALRALLARAQGEPDAALSAAERAVRLAAPGGYLRLFVELGAEMAELLAQLAARGVALKYTDRVLAVFSADQAAESPVLTGRELEILALLQQGLSDKEIAGRLVLSVATVKKHNSNVYRKLGVSDRRRAVAKAKALDLLR